MEKYRVRQESDDPKKVSRNAERSRHRRRAGDGWTVV